jgi:hypothetical protein
VIKPKRSVVSAVERKTTTGSNAKDKATTAKTKKVTMPTFLRIFTNVKPYKPAKLRDKYWLAEKYM